MTLSSQVATYGLTAIARAASPSVTWRERLGSAARSVNLPLAVTGFEAAGVLGGIGNAFTVDMQTAIGTPTGSGAYATGVLTFTGNALANGFVTVGSRVYTWKVTAAAANDVKIGATASISIDNLIAAINGDAGAGTLYGTGTVAHADVTAAIGTGDTMGITADVIGTSGNAIATIATMTNATWAASTLTGGVTATAITGANGEDMEGVAIPTLVKIVAVELVCTAGGLTLDWGAGVSTFAIPAGGVFSYVAPAGSSDLITDDFAFQATSADSTFTLTVLATIS